MSGRRSDRSRRAGESSDVVVGRRPALEAVRAGAAREVLVARTARPTPALRDLLAAAEAGGIPTRRVDPSVIERMATGAAHQGVAVRTRGRRERVEADLVATDWPDRAVVVVLDGVTDPGNVGAVARTAEAAGASALVVRRRRGAGSGPAVVKASAGALLHLPLFTVANVSRAVGRLKEEGFWVVGLDGGAETTIWEDDPPAGRLAVVLGSEDRGLSRLVRDSCDLLVAIPMAGRVGSVNVSAAAAVALFAYAVRPTAGGRATLPSPTKSRIPRTDSGDSSRFQGKPPLAEGPVPHT